MTDDELIKSLADRLYICSRLLTCAAERLGWESERIQELIAEWQNLVDESSQEAVH